MKKEVPAVSHALIAAPNACMLTSLSVSEFQLNYLVYRISRYNLPTTIRIAIASSAFSGINPALLAAHSIIASL